jgi:hypothetical protein
MLGSSEWHLVCRKRLLDRYRQLLLQISRHFEQAALGAEFEPVAGLHSIVVTPSYIRRSARTAADAYSSS